ncbi:MAG: hypothetical protein QM820_64320 [Minicystis sp.]
MPLARSFRFVSAVLVSLASAALAAGCSENVGETHDPLTAVCVDQGTQPPDGAWVCNATTTVECGAHEGAWVDYIYVTPNVDALCADTTLTVSQPGPWLPGTYTVDVTASVNGGPAGAVCSSTLVVVDTQPPAITAHDVALWPPNHKYHHVTPADCVTILDACDAAPKLWFTWASSDEPDDDLGDGSTGSDIANLGCDGVDLRSERQGGSDGRVYTLGWHAEDHAGNAVDGTCRVIVAHDQSGAGAVDSGEAYHVDLPAGACQ